MTHSWSFIQNGVLLHFWLKTCLNSSSMFPRIRGYFGNDIFLQAEAGFLLSFGVFWTIDYQISMYYLPPTKYYYLLCTTY